MPNRRTLILSGLGAGVVAAAGGLGLKHSLSGSKATKPVVLYTSNGMEVVEAALTAVAARDPSLAVTQVTGGTGVLMKRIMAEASAPQGDIFWSGGFGTLGAYAAGFTPYASRVATAIPAALIQPAHLWTGTNIHVMLLMANAAEIGSDRPPATWQDLFDPRWRGRIAMTNPLNSSFTYITVYALLRAFGMDGLTRLAANLVVTGTTGQTTRGVAEGEYALGITSEAAAYEYVAAGQQGLSLIYPREGVVLSPEGVALVKGARHPIAARALYDAFLSKDVQEAILRATYRRPSRGDIAVSRNVPFPELAGLAALPADHEDAARGRDAVLTAWKTAVATADRLPVPKASGA